MQLIYTLVLIVSLFLPTALSLLPFPMSSSF